MPARSPALGYVSAVQQNDTVGVSCVAQEWSESSANADPAHLRTFSTSWNKLGGQTQLIPVLHGLAETIRQRALIVILSVLFVEPELLRGCFQHLRFRSTM